MEVLSSVSQLGHALLTLKGMYDQHGDNKNEIKELQSFVQDYEEHMPALEKRFKQGAGNNVSTIVLNQLQRDLVEATDKLQNWSANKSFFRVVNAGDRMMKLEKLHKKVLASVQKNLGIASLSTLMDVRESQATILESHAELKSVVTTFIESVPGFRLPEVRAGVEEASQMSFADQKFWADVLAALNKREAEAPGETQAAPRDTDSFFMDPIMKQLIIDPVVASNGHTFCRWTIIDNNMKKDPYNLSDDLTILVDNLTIRSRLFEEFPEQLKEFQKRREKFRCKALELVSKELFGDAAVALQYVLQWDKNDQKCATALLQVQKTLKKEVGGSELPSDSKDKVTASALWDYKSAKAIVTFLDHQGEDYLGEAVLECVAWSPDGGRLATANSKENTVRIWDVKLGSLLGTMKGFLSLVISLAWSPNGNQVATVTRNSVSLWNANSDFSRLWKFNMKSESNRSAGPYIPVVWDRDGVNLTIGVNYGSLLRLTTESGLKMKPKYSCEVVEYSRVESLSWNPDGVRLAIGCERGAVVWSMGSSQTILFTKTAKGLRQFGKGWLVAWSPDGNQLATACKEEVYNYDEKTKKLAAGVWTGVTGKLLISLQLDFPCSSVAWSPDGSQISTSFQEIATVWEVKSGSKMFKVKALLGSLAWSPMGGLLATGCANKDAAIWDSKTGNRLHTLKGHTGLIHSLAWSPEGDCIATGLRDGTVRLWGKNDGEATSVGQCSASSGKFKKIMGMKQQ